VLCTAFWINIKEFLYMMPLW